MNSELAGIEAQKDPIFPQITKVRESATGFVESQRKLGFLTRASRSGKVFWEYCPKGRANPDKYEISLFGGDDPLEDPTLLISREEGTGLLEGGFRVTVFENKVGDNTTVCFRYTPIENGREILEKRELIEIATGGERAYKPTNPGSLEPTPGFSNAISSTLEAISYFAELGSGETETQGSTPINTIIP